MGVAPVIHVPQQIHAVHVVGATRVLRQTPVARVARVARVVPVDPVRLAAHPPNVLCLASLQAAIRVQRNPLAGRAAGVILAPLVIPATRARRPILALGPIPALRLTHVARAVHAVPAAVRRRLS